MRALKIVFYNLNEFLGWMLIYGRFISSFLFLRKKETKKHVCQKIRLKATALNSMDKELLLLTRSFHSLS